jgi:hypothetical protein
MYVYFGFHLSGSRSKGILSYGFHATDSLNFGLHAAAVIYLNTINRSTVDWTKYGSSQLSIYGDMAAHLHTDKQAYRRGARSIYIAKNRSSDPGSNFIWRTLKYVQHLSGTEWLTDHWTHFRCICWQMKCSNPFSDRASYIPESQSCYRIQSLVVNWGLGEPCRRQSSKFPVQSVIIQIGTDILITLSW